MLARWIATVAALLLACAQAGAQVRTENSVGVVDLAGVTASLGELAQKSKTAPPARASFGEPAPGENPHVTHCHIWQKSFSAEKSTSGDTIWRWDSAPFGETAANEQPTVGLPSFTLNLRFPGQQYDRETGTHYNYFRDYEAGTGRYVQSDPVGLEGGSLTPFIYVSNDPGRFEDPWGLSKGGKGSKAETGGGCCKPAKRYPDGSRRTPDGKFASAAGEAAPGTSKAREFANFLSSNGMDVVGEEMVVCGPVGDRRCDIVVRRNGKLHCIEIKSGSASRGPYQRFTDMCINQKFCPGKGRGRLKGQRVSSVTTVFVD